MSAILGWVVTAFLQSTKQLLFVVMNIPDQCVSFQVSDALSTGKPQSPGGPVPSRGQNRPIFQLRL